MVAFKTLLVRLLYHRLHDEAVLLKTGQKRWPSLLFFIVGLASLLWLAVRSAPKPSRLTYPCQKAAAANIMVMFGWFGSVLIATLFSKRLTGVSRWVYRGVVLTGVVALTLGGLRGLYLSEWQRRFVSTAVGQGTSRVVWVTDSRAGLGWDADVSRRVNAAVADEMMDLAITQFTGQPTVAAAWAQIFSDHNGGTGYQPGETIVIKVNYNNAANENQLNPNYQIVNALLRQLVDVVGVNQSDIVLYDAIRDFQAKFSAGIQARFPNVVLDPDVCWYGSVLGTEFTCFLQDADYLINMPLFRNHYRAGATFSLKNHLGSVHTPSLLHDALLDPDPAKNSLVILNSQPVIRDKTLLIVADAIYGLKAGGPDGYPGTSDGITNPLPNAIFMATDPVASDSVMADYLENRGADYTFQNPRVYLSAAATAGLGNYDTSLTYDYTLIDLIHCEDGSCSGAANQPPVAANDAYTTAFETALTVKKPGVLANDSDADGGALTAALATHPAHGAAVLSADGALTYTPAAGFHGQDTFTYTATDSGGESDTATVTITVQAKIPAAPVLSAPANNSVINIDTPEFSWGAVDGGVSYQIQIDTSPSFAIPEQKQTFTGTRYTASPLPDEGTRYYWRVRALNSDSLPGPWSTVWRVTVDLVKPGTPRLSSPLNRTHIARTTPRFVWRAAAGAQAYRLQVSTDPAFPLPLVIDTPTTQRNYTGSLPYGAYFWRVQAIDAGGNESDWSEAFSFVITILRSPANGEFTTDSTPTLRWFTVNGAQAYRLQVSTDPAFPLPLTLDKSLPRQGAYTFETPLSNGRYYWRMQVDDGAWMLPWALTVTLSGPPGKPILTTPDNHAQIDAPAILFGWDALPDAAIYQLQIDDTRQFTSPVQDVLHSGTSLTADPLAESGTYYWRVRALNDQGVAGQWSRPLVLVLTGSVRPTLSAPANRSVTGQAAPDFVWDALPGSTGYEIQIGLDQQFKTLPPTVSVSGPGYTADALADGVYYWRVRALNDQGVAGVWSKVWSVRVDTLGPDAPTLKTPRGSTLDTTPRFVWSGLRDAVFYHVQIAPGAVFASLVTEDDTLTGPRFTLPDTYALADGVYYWRVKGRDALGNWGEWSAPQSFSVSILQSPANGSASTQARPVFRWSAVGGVSEYTIQVDTDAGFPAPFIDAPAYAPHFQPGGPLAPGVYYWRVRPVGGSWTPGWMLTITPKPPLKPRLVSPAKNTLMSNTLPVFMWQAAASGETYQLQVDDDKQFGSPAQDVTVGDLYATAALTDGRYYWRVRAINSVGVPGPWSARWAFVVDSTPPAVPEPTGPAAEARITNRKFALTWAKTAGAAQYEIQLDPDPGFPLPPVNVGQRTRYQPPESLAQMAYYWRVRAVDKAGNVSGWSDTRVLNLVAGNTILLTPEPPQLVPTPTPVPAPPVAGPPADDPKKEIPGEVY